MRYNIYGRTFWGWVWWWYRAWALAGLGALVIALLIVGLWG